MADDGEAGSSSRSDEPCQKSYADMLELPQLLALQKLVADPPVHDEMLFLIVHQTHELWFKQMIWELRALITHIDAGALSLAELTADRLSLIIGLLTRHVDVLQTMPPEEFQKFRAALGSASGLQSEQFKSIEALAGGLGVEETDAPARIAGDRAPSRSVREAFSRAIGASLAGSGAATSEAAHAALFRAPERAAERRLAERLLHLDAEMVRWRGRHMELALEMIGGAAGTGGSAGARYLQRTLAKRFFPELWAARVGDPASGSE